MSVDRDIVGRGVRHEPPPQCRFPGEFHHHTLRYLSVRAPLALSEKSGTRTTISCWVFLEEKAQTNVYNQVLVAGRHFVIEGKELVSDS